MSMFYETTPDIVEGAFKKLLSEKHLYQSVELDLTSIKRFAEECEIERSTPGSSRDMSSKQEWIKTGKEELAGSWIPKTASFPLDADTVLDEQVRASVTFKVPSITTYCEKCVAAWPHNPTENIVPIRSRQNQCFLFEYLCQKCQSALIRFQIRREGLKIRLTGRDPIEVLPTPKELPKEMARYFGSAHIAHNAG
jgi:hypothetical protein